jgi:hypothetical protein
MGSMGKLAWILGLCLVLAGGLFWVFDRSGQTERQGALLEPAGPVDEAAPATRALASSVDLVPETGAPTLSPVEALPAAETRAPVAPALHQIRVVDMHGDQLTGIYGTIEWHTAVAGPKGVLTSDFGKEKLRVTHDDLIELKRMPKATEALSASLTDPSRKIVLKLRGDQLVDCAIRFSKWRVVDGVYQVTAERLIRFGFQMVGSKGQGLSGVFCAADFVGPTSPRLNAQNERDRGKPQRSTGVDVRLKIGGSVPEGDLPCEVEVRAEGFHPTSVLVPSSNAGGQGEADLGTFRMTPLRPGAYGRLWLGEKTPLANTDLVIKDAYGEVFMTGRTNSEGRFAFEGLLTSECTLDLREPYLAGPECGLPLVLQSGQDNDAHLGLTRWEYRAVWSSESGLETQSLPRVLTWRARLADDPEMSFELSRSNVLKFLSSDERAHEIFVQGTLDKLGIVSGTQRSQSVSSPGPHYATVELDRAALATVRFVPDKDASVFVILTNAKTGHAIRNVEQSTTSPPIEIYAGQWVASFHRVRVPRKIVVDEWDDGELSLSDLGLSDSDGVELTGDWPIPEVSEQAFDVQAGQDLVLPIHLIQGGLLVLGEPEEKVEGEHRVPILINRSSFNGVQNDQAEDSPDAIELWDLSPAPSKPTLIDQARASRSRQLKQWKTWLLPPGQYRIKVTRFPTQAERIQGTDIKPKLVLDETVRVTAGQELAVPLPVE